MLSDSDFLHRSKRIKSTLTRKVMGCFCAAIFLLVSITGVYAAPSSGVVTTGSGNITQNDNILTITQTTNKMGINWQSFNIASGETVVFIQPGFSSIALNRVLGSEASAIYGQLQANGKVFLINPNGILFAPSAQVNVGSLAASTLNISDSDFQAGNYVFNGAGGSVVNQGNIKAADGGYVVLLGRQVNNQGVISANLGTVALGAGNAVTLDMNGDGLINLAVDTAAADAGILNGNLLQADGGRVLMTARTADALAGTVINNSGIIQANSISNANGVIRLDGGNTGTVMNSGALSAAGKNPGENGGLITLQGGDVQLSSASAFDASGTTGGTLKISTAGDLALTNLLTAGNNANIVLRADRFGSGSGTVNISGDGAVSLLGNGTAEIYYNPVSYTSPIDYSGKVTGGPLMAYMLVNNINQLQNVNTNLAGTYVLGKDIDASATAGWNSGSGFTPIGGNNAFSGNFNGDNHIISNLYINRPSKNYVGLFGVSTGNIKNIGLANVSITGGAYYTGGLAGISYNPISGSYSTGTVNGSYYVGGLVGLSYDIISNSYSTGTVSGYMYVGGLVGDQHVGSSADHVYSSGSVNGTNHVGGLVGGNTYGSISNSYSHSIVNGAADSKYVGGLVGHNGNDSGASGGIINNSYSTGDVNGNSGVGGLTGINSGSINNCYSTGAVSGNIDFGGLVGANLGRITNSYWNVTTSDQANSAGGIGLTTSQMMNQDNFTSWDFVNTWRIYGGYTYPLLKSFLTPLTVTANDFSRSYDGTTGYSGNAGVSYSIKPTDSLLGTVFYGGTAQNAVNTGSYNIVPSGLYSNQQGYDISYADGMLTITPRPITVTANASRVYGDANPASGPVSVAPGSLVGDDALSDANLSSSATVTSNVGSYSLTPSGVTFTSGNASNYTITYADGTLTITPRPLTVTANASRVYGDANPASGPVSVAPGSLVGSDALSDANLSSAATVASNVGSYSLTPSGVVFTSGSASNYTITYADGTLTITPRPITVTASGRNKVYDGTNAAAVTFSDNRISGDDLTVSGNATFADKNAGTNKTINVTDINISGEDASNYNLQNTFTFTVADIAKAFLTIKANDATKKVGANLPKFSATADGFVNGESWSSLNGKIVFTTAATKRSPPGSYTITPSGYTSNNYTINYVNGMLIVYK